MDAFWDAAASFWAELAAWLGGLSVWKLAGVAAATLIALLWLLYLRKPIGRALLIVLLLPIALCAILVTIIIGLPLAKLRGRGVPEFLEDALIDPLTVLWRALAPWRARFRLSGKLLLTVYLIIAAPIALVIVVFLALSIIAPAAVL